MPLVVLRAILLTTVVLARAETLSYWIAPGPDSELAKWAFEAWQKASGGSLGLKESSRREDAQIRLIWASAEEGFYGEARPVVVNGHHVVDIYVRPAPYETSDFLLRQAITYLTCLHESGHALGLQHTSDFADIMYSFQYGGDIPEYFARYRRQLRSRADIRNHSGISDSDREQLMKAVHAAR